MSIAKASLKLTGLFEAELLVELMLRYWKHPLASDREFRNDLLEKAAESLRAAIHCERLIRELPPEDMSLVAAVWYVEWHNLSGDTARKNGIRKGREKWLTAVRQSIPSCFCDPEQPRE